MDFERFETKLKRRGASTDSGQHDPRLNAEAQNTFEFYSKSYDDPNTFKQESTIELRQLKQRLDILTDKVENIATAIEESHAAVQLSL